MIVATADARVAEIYEAGRPKRTLASIASDAIANPLDGSWTSAGGVSMSCDARLVSAHIGGRQTIVADLGRAGAGAARVFDGTLFTLRDGSGLWGAKQDAAGRWAVVLGRDGLAHGVESALLLPLAHPPPIDPDTGHVLGAALAAAGDGTAIALLAEDGALVIVTDSPDGLRYEIRETTAALLAPSGIAMDMAGSRILVAGTDPAGEPALLLVDVYGGHATVLLTGLDPLDAGVELCAATRDLSVVAIRHERGTDVLYIADLAAGADAGLTHAATLPQPGAAVVALSERGVVAVLDDDRNRLYDPGAQAVYIVRKSEAIPWLPAPIAEYASQTSVLDFYPSQKLALFGQDIDCRNPIHHADWNLVAHGCTPSYRVSIRSLRMARVDVRCTPLGGGDGAGETEDLEVLVPLDAPPRCAIALFEGDEMHFVDSLVNYLLVPASREVRVRLARNRPFRLTALACTWDPDGTCIDITRLARAATHLSRTVPGDPSQLPPQKTPLEATLAAAGLVRDPIDSTAHGPAFLWTPHVSDQVTLAPRPAEILLVGASLVVETEFTALGLPAAEGRVEGSHVEVRVSTGRWEITLHEAVGEPPQGTLAYRGHADVDAGDDPLPAELETYAQDILGVILDAVLTFRLLAD